MTPNEVVIRDPALIRAIEKELEMQHLDTINKANTEIKQMLQEQAKRNKPNDR
ncbi:hypothetical protein [Sulfurovum sp.]|uniref:hypothetical protein n=1 Tax=Sulfurovum sp. TaxID=1969726 RepID=UPI003562ABF7